MMFIPTGFEKCAGQASRAFSSPGVGGHEQQRVKKSAIQRL